MMDMDAVEAILNIQSEVGSTILRKDAEIARLKAALEQKDKDIANLVRLLKEGRAMVEEYSAAVDAAKATLETFQRAAQDGAR